MSSYRERHVGVLRLLPLYLSLTTFVSRCAAHMKMSYPRSLGDPALGGPNPDYDLTSPLDRSGSDYPCKGYANAAWNPQAAWTAGQSYNMSVSGGASHRGGSCQLSLSYDKQIFRVIRSIIGGCPLALTYAFTIPSNAPSGQALFAWTWQNEVGNREFYMNCAQVDILGTSSTPYVKRADALPDLPQIWVANIPAVNNCTTTEGEDPVYPAPGCGVEYSGPYNESSPPPPTSNPGECDFGSSQPACSGAQSGLQNPGMIMAEMPSPSSSQTMLSLSTITDFGPSSTRFATALPPLSLTDPLNGEPLAPLFGQPLAIQGPGDPSNDPASSCPGDITVTATAPTITVTSTPSSPPAATTTTSATATSRPYPPPGGGAGYAGGNIMAYMPCEPGYFLCSDRNTFYTCDQTTNPSQRWVWQYPRQVAAGMMCQPQLVACVPGSEGCSTGAGIVPAGFTREDQYVRAT